MAKKIYRIIGEVLGLLVLILIVDFKLGIAHLLMERKVFVINKTLFYIGAILLNIIAAVFFLYIGSDSEEEEEDEETKWIKKYLTDSENILLWDYCDRKKTALKVMKYILLLPRILVYFINISEGEYLCALTDKRILMIRTLCFNKNKRVKNYYVNDVNLRPAAGKCIDIINKTSGKKETFRFKNENTVSEIMRKFSMIDSSGEIKSNV